MSNKESEHVRHSQHATTKFKVDVAAKVVAEMAVLGVVGKVFPLQSPPLQMSINSVWQWWLQSVGMGSY